MTKIAIAHIGVGDTIILSLQNELQEKMKQVLNQEDIELLIDTYSPQYTYPLDCDESFLLCSVSTAVNKSLLSTDCHIIPIAYGEVMEQKDMDSSLQNINAFLYDEGNSDKSIEQLCEIFLSKIGLMKNARKVFISYKRSETSKLAENVRKELIKEGYSVFLDKSDIDVGVDFMQEIRYSIAESDIFLMLNSKTYYDSIYTKKELYAACISGLAIIVLSQENTMVKELCGLTCIHILENDKINEEEKNKLIKEIGNARTKLWQSRHNRLNNKLLMLKEYEKSLQGVYLPTRLSNLMYPVLMRKGGRQMNCVMLRQ